MAAISEPRAPGAPVSRRQLPTFIKAAVVQVLAPRADNTCSPQPGVNLCEKPGISSQSVTWIIVGTVLGVLLLVTFGIIAYLTIRRRRRDKQEDIEDRFQTSDYGLDELSSRKSRPGDDDTKWSQDGSPNGYGRRSRDPLHAGTEPRYQNGQLNGHLNPFDDATSVRSGNGSSYPPSVNPAWPKRESSQQPPATEGGR